ncbi:MAG: hypothetical protein K2H38_06210 [Muribaculaceae bacterium]|nr:hypothetical protein [Muribaculaceae bacterium]
MKKIILLTGILAISLAVHAQQQEPKMIEDAIICGISPNGQYAVSQGASGLRIFNLATGEEYVQYSELGYAEYYAGDGNCVSDNGIVVASTPKSSDAQYWKDGEWHSLPLPPNALTSNHAQAINADGSRICGTIRLANMGGKEEVLMVEPYIWIAEGDGYGMPVKLPHPDRDYSNSIPQYITAIDISADGKTIVGQIRDAWGIVNYPIVYKENENGQWTYEIPHEELINPDHLEAVPFPGDGPAMPQFESFMTAEEIEAYNEAFSEYVNSGTQITCPEYWDFMTQKEIDEYNEAVEVYNEKAIAYNEKFKAWLEYISAIALSSPNYAFNQLRISADGKTLGTTVMVEGELDPMTGDPSIENTVWLFDLTSDKITKYSKDEDLNIFYVADNGVGIGTTSAGTASNSYILKDGEVIDIASWIDSKVPEYGTFIKDNMMFPYLQLVDGQIVSDEVLMTGRAMATPDLSLISLSVENVWDNTDDGLCYIFDMKTPDSVETIRPASEEKTIFDLSGRRLRNAANPGIYIIDGEKKVVR